SASDAEMRTAVETMLARLEREHAWAQELRADLTHTEREIAKLLSACDAAIHALPTGDRVDMRLRVARIAKQDYRPNEIIAADEDISGVMNLLESGHFNPDHPGLFDLLIGGLRSPHDPWVTIGDLRSYIDAQAVVGKAYQSVSHWNQMSILNTAGSGWFSSDRTIKQYADDIWDVRSLV
ncbi:MAG: glycogen/starch/alpha-glucan phosphorylase, partial [Planctomycetota bacterium]